MINQAKVNDVRRAFAQLLAGNHYTTVNREASMTGLVGNSTIEITGASFIADSESIFGEVNWEYVAREEAWYNSKSLNVNDIPGGAPQIWKAVADSDGFINSNYGWTIYSHLNLHNAFDLHPRTVIPMLDSGEVANQYNSAKRELQKNPESRRAIMIYTRPSMWLDYNKDGRSDFMCTNTVQYLIREGMLEAVVQMRSNDAWAGYRNDRAWQQHVLEKLAKDLNIEAGKITWQVGSLHIYSRQFYLVDHFARSGEIHISKSDYRELYPDSPYC